MWILRYTLMLAVMVLGCGQGSNGGDPSAGAGGAGPLPPTSGTGQGAADGDAGLPPPDDASTGQPFWTVFPTPAVRQGSRRAMVLGPNLWAIQWGQPQILSGEVSQIGQVWTEDGGATWQRMESGYASPGFRDGTFWFLGRDHSGTLLGVSARAPDAVGVISLIRHDTATRTWIPVGQVPDGFEPITMVASAAGTWMHGRGGLWRYDGPDQWTSIPYPDGVSNATSLRASEDGSLVLLAEYTERLFRRGPSDTSWSEIPTSSIPEPANELFQDVVQDGRGTLYLVSNWDSVWRSDDGERWTDVTPSASPKLDSASTWHVAASASGVLAVGRFEYSKDNENHLVRVWLSKDAGASWTERSEGLEPHLLSHMVFDEQERLLVVTDLDKVVLAVSPPADRW
ncbi:WD40/YVTN/BNR-like repeat-containing protein [Sorangium sp. So ce1078]|uniref:WD40/YVTN/BNR-like repeat-containing protein n=1 Tax=Sorangium sp. So ce1078 TaxID=3133329 RepID=UPI003F63AF00